MKRLVLFLVICCLAVGGIQALGQGELIRPNWPDVAFVTYYPNSGIDAPVTYADGTRVGPEFTAQLLGGPAGTPVSALEPLFPTAQFSNFADQPEYNGYVFDGSVHVPN